MPEFDESASAAHGEGDTPHGGSASVALEHDPEGLTVRIVGELDLSTVPQLSAVLGQIDGNNPGRLLLDLDGVTFMDSSGLAVLVHAQHAAEQHGYRLTVRYSSPQVARLFELTGMLQYFARE